MWRIEVSLITRADSGLGAIAVGAATPADRRALLSLVQIVAPMTATVVRSNAVAVTTAADANGLAIFHVAGVAELARADVRRYAVGVARAATSADRATDPGLGAPAVLAGADVGPGAGAADAAVLAVGLALAGVVVPHVAVAAVDHRYPGSVTASRFNTWWR